MSAPGEVGCNLEAESEGGLETSFDSGYSSTSWPSLKSPSDFPDFVFPSPSPNPNLDLTPAGLVGLVCKGGGGDVELDLELNDEEGEEEEDEEEVFPRVASHMARS